MNLRVFMLFCLQAMLLPSLVYGQNWRSDTFRTTSTFTPPEGVTSVTVEAWGAGGGGGSAATEWTSGGGGGGGAYTKKLNVPVVGGRPYQIIVGTGGRSIINNTAESGGVTSANFDGMIITAEGGKGGERGLVLKGGLGVGGEGGSQGTYKGGRGSNGIIKNGFYSGGGGGASAGVSNDGANGNGSVGGTAINGGGAGGNGNTNFGNGLPGETPGGGGGGACRTNTPTLKIYGGDGANGQVVISWVTCTSPIINSEMQPANQNTTYGFNASFSVAAYGQGSLAYQWEVSTPSNFNWVAISNDDLYSGAKTSTLTLTKPAVTLSGNKYRCKVSGCNPLQTTFSEEASLVVSRAGAVVMFSNLEYTYEPLAPRLATVTTIPVGLDGVITRYFKNGVEVPVSDIIDAGEYVVEVTLDNDNYNLVDAQGQVLSKETGLLIIEKAEQTIQVTVPAPQHAVYQSSFNVEATTSSGLPVSYIGSFPLVQTGKVFTMASGTGTGSVKLIQEGNENFKPAEVIVLSVAAEKANQAIIWPTPESIIYGTSLQAKQLNASAWGGAMLTYIPDFGVILDAGSHELMVYAAETSDYKSSSAKVSIKVDKAPATIALDALKHSYSGSAKAVIAMTSPADLAGLNISYKQDNTLIASPVEAGRYEVIATLSNKNFEAIPVQDILIIDQATGAITLNNLFQTYSGVPLMPEVSTVPEGLMTELTYDGQTVPPTNAGSYTVIGTIRDPNYQGLVTGTLVIDKAPTTVTFSGLDHTYDGTSKKALVATYPPDLPGLMVRYYHRIGTESTEVSAEEVRNAGTYEIEAVLENPNYQLSADGAPVFAILEIKKAATVIKIDIKDAAYDGSAKGGIASVRGEGGLDEPLPINYAGQTLAGDIYSSDQAPTAAGVYSATAIYEESANYAGCSVTKTFSIAAAPASIRITDLNRTYSGAAQGVTVRTTPENLVVAVTYDGYDAIPVNAGSYLVEAALTNSNYKLKDDLGADLLKQTGTLVIGPRTLAIATNNKSKVYGTDNPVLDGTESGLVESDGISVSYSTEAEATSDVGAYTITATITDPKNKLVNYSVTIAEGKLVIIPAPAIITLSNLNSTYDGTPKFATAIADPVAAGTHVKYFQGGIEVAAPITAGSYEIEAVLANKNYTAAPVTSTLVINKAVTKSTVNVSSIIYDGKPHGATASVTGNGGLNQTLVVTYTGTTNAGSPYSSNEPPTEAGDYAAEASYAENNNYIGSSDSKIFSISKAAPTLSVREVSVVFDGSPHAASAKVSGVNGEVIDADITYTYVGTPNGAPLHSYNSTIAPVLAGTYSVKASFAGNNNYNSTDATASVKIFAIPIVALSAPNPVAINNSSAITATLGYDVYNVQWFFTSDQNITTGNSLNSTGLNIRSSTPNVYSVYVTFEDGLGHTGYISDKVYAVFFDPSAGFVTGGGWIISPKGAYAKDPELVGKAHFGFVSKYEKGKTIPTGNTEFQFQAGGMNFRSSEYEYLVVAGARAQFKGKGTINGSGSYGFMLSAVDENLQGGSTPDKFRIKIWDNNDGGKVVYDNQMDHTEDAVPTATIGGGSIVIHTPVKKTNAVAADARAGERFETAKFSMKAFPNPSVSGFNIQVGCDHTEGKITLRVLDLNGWTIEMINNVSPGQTYSIGRNYRPGIYLVEMIQGSRRSQTMLLKVTE